MFEAIIYLLIQITLFLIVVAIIVYALNVWGITIPARVMQLFYLLIVLIVILLVFRMLPGLGHGKLFGALAYPFIG